MLKLKKFFVGLLAAAGVAGLSFASVAKEIKTSTEVITRDTVYGKVAFATKQGVAYDPVAAYNHRILRADCSAHSLIDKSVKWCFASAKNRELFAKAPKRYMPAFGGRCTLGLARGNPHAKGDPRTAVRVGNKTVLNGSFRARNGFLADTRMNMHTARMWYGLGKRSGAIVANEKKSTASKR